MRLRAGWLSLVLLGACLPDNPSVEAGSEGADQGEVERVEEGLLGCPSGESCIFIALSQTLDDRVDLFAVRGEGGPRYQGGLDLDLKANDNGNINGELLDEPYGMGWDGEELHVLLGHYPQRAVGSLLSIPAAGLVDYAPGSFVPRGDWFSGGQTSGALGIRLTGLEREEALSLLLHPPSGELLVGVFANDLGVPENQWLEPSQLLSFSPPAESGVAAPKVTDLGCVGAWSLVALDEDADTVALVCDGDETVVLIETSGLSEGQAPEPLCTGSIPFLSKRVRYMAPDGLGGVLVVEHPQVLSATEVARVWWFDGACGLRGVSDLVGTSSWMTRELTAVPGPAPRWLLARTDGDARGVVILAGEPGDGSVLPCGRLEGFDDAGAWVSPASADLLRPHALALSRDGLGLALSTGPANYEDAAPGYGSVWWAELDYAGGEDICAATAPSPIELGALAPAVDPAVPQTWRRGPDVLELIEVPLD